ncbi:hypothetical protein SAMN05421505_102180 [Sinosporangium album]|uniref:Uncharacterized protein n=1 Tax=Sinosporangium album TaxID=504805 RepID=A0A1G7S8A0_9ACTN|nr:hypothetical protein [Sinosporangium album]SDG18400.1 hypothetical protein SAMN05421505_102180 [Sinosporangium album]
MTQAPDEHGDFLRRVLRAEADTVVPSPDALEIIRTRIERRGIRGLFWWRAGASIAGAVLVAAAVVMVVPSLRQQVTQEDRQITEVKHGSREPEASGTSRPVPPGTPPPPPQHDPAAVVPPPPARPPAATPSGTPSSRQTSQTSPTPRKPSSCPSQPNEADAAGRCPTIKPSPSPSPKPSATDSEAPCAAEECPPTEPEPTTPDLSTPPG